jgi:RNA-directed DNA polymerase
VDWHQIDWDQAHRTVRRLQARIVKATQAGRWGRVKALQRLLTHSFSGKALAVRRVTENQGKRTPGVDGATWDTPAKKARAVQALRQRGYHPKPLRRVYIPKKHGKRRPLGIPTCHPYCLSLQGKFGMRAGQGRQRHPPLLYLGGALAARLS